MLRGGAEGGSIRVVPFKFVGASGHKNGTVPIVMGNVSVRSLRLEGT